MPLTREQKQGLLDGYADELAHAPTVFVLGYKGIKVPDVTELRRRVRQSGGSYVVVKNTLIKRAAKDVPLALLDEHFSGPTAVAYSSEDPVALAKVLTDFAKENPVLEFKAGLVEGRALPGNAVQDIARLPGRQELVAKLLYLLQSPITRFVRTLAAVPRQLVVALDQVRQQKEGG